MKQTIECQYSCRKCGIRRQKLNVVARGAGEDVKEWLDQAALAMGHDHDQRSPLCRIADLSEVWIPVDEEMPIGSPVTPKAADLKKKLRDVELN
jgi:hypothetical protein